MSRYTAVPSREIGPASSDSEAEALLPSHLAIAPVHTLGVKCSEPLFRIVMMVEASAAYAATPSYIPGGALEAGPDLIQTQDTLQCCGKWLRFCVTALLRCCAAALLRFRRCCVSALAALLRNFVAALLCCVAALLRCCLLYTSPSPRD